MMTIKGRRTEAQFNFDQAKHIIIDGLAFSDQQMLTRRIARLEIIAKRLSPDDERHGELANLKQVAQGRER